MNGEGFQELVLKKLEFLDTLANDVADIKKGQSNLDKIDASQIRMEGELIEKVRVLFDAREAQNDVRTDNAYS